MQEIHASQVKAARALIGWSQEDLAGLTGLSSTTIRKIENGVISPRSRTMNAIRDAIEKAGWELIYPEGIRRRQQEITIYNGVDGKDRFYNAMMEHVRANGCEIYASFLSQDMLMRSLGAHTKSNINRLDQLNEVAQVKCLLAEPNDMPLLLQNFQFRTITERYMAGAPFFIYGNNIVFALPEGKESFQYLLHSNGNLSQCFQSRFHDLWDVANPLLHAINGKNARTG